MRFLIVAIVLYFVLRFLGRILNAFLNTSRSPSPNPPPTPAPPRQSEEFTDVHDARFVDIEDKRKEENNNQPESRS